MHLSRLIKELDLDVVYHGRAGTRRAGRARPVLPGRDATPRSTPSAARTRRGCGSSSSSSPSPAAIGSHCTPETPGSIHEGGELGYVLSHACGAAFDNPDLIVAAVVGDGEAETGPLATSWHINKFLNPIRDGAVLPILHLNGYKINNPTIWRGSATTRSKAFFKGYGWTPYFVEGSDPETACTRRWRPRSSSACRTSAPRRRRPASSGVAHAPALADDRPAHAQGLDRARRRSAGTRLEGFWRSHQVPMADVHEEPGRT